MRKLTLVISALFLSSLAYGQSLTTVTATITDPSTQAFVAGTATAEFQRAFNSQGVTPVINGTPIVERPAQVALDGTGTFTINLANLLLVAPTGGKWRFTLCPNASSSCFVVDSLNVVGASVNLSISLSAGVSLLSVPAQPTISRAYKDPEVILAPGIVWLDVTLNVVKYVDALGIIHIIGGGTITGATPGGGLVVTGTTLGLRLDCGPNQTLLFNVIWGCGNLGITGIGTINKIPKWATTTSLTDSVATDIVNEFSGCSSVLYLGADGACHTVASAAFYQTLQRNAVPLTQRPIFNFSTRFTATDNPGATRTDVDTNSPGTGALVATYVSSPGASTALAGFDGLGNLTPTTATIPGNNTGVPQKVSLGSPVALVANTQTIILTETVTFPSSGGPYRADSRYGVYVTVGANACAAEVIDTTNTRAFAFSGHNTNGGGFIGMTGSEISTQTYAASATATFTLQVICNNGAGGLVGATVNSGLFTLTPAEATYLSVTPVLSN